SRRSKETSMDGHEAVPLARQYVYCHGCSAWYCCEVYHRGDCHGPFTEDTWYQIRTGHRNLASVIQCLRGIERSFRDERRNWRIDMVTAVRPDALLLRVRKPGKPRRPGHDRPAGESLGRQAGEFQED